MADAIKVNVYKIGNSINTKLMGFPVISSEFSATPSGQIRVGDVDCYGLIAFNGNQHYVKETVAELVTLANAGSSPGGSQDLESVLTEGNDAGGLTIDNLADPSTDQQAATKKYVDDNAGGLGYDVYVALLTQSGTDAPVATVLQNTLGGTVVWARVSDGYYTGTLAGAFPTGRTICFLTNGYLLGFLVGTVDSSPDVIGVSSYVGGTPTDGQMGDASIEIRLYPE